MSNYVRSNSILCDPQQQLLDYVKTNNIKQVARLLENNRGLVAKEYDSQLTILELACWEFADCVDPQTIKILLDFGADPKRTFDEHSNQSALHFATLGQNPKLLELIASNRNVEINATSNGRTALHLLVIDGDPNNKMKECAEVLWRHGIDLHSADNNSNTALYFAAKEKFFEIVKFILSKDNTVTSKEADVLRKLDPSLHYVIDDNARTLSGLDYLKRNNEAGFITWCSTNVDFDEDTLEKSFLQTAVERHLLTAVDFLIDRDPNKVGTSSNKHPLIIAVEMGYYQIVERFIKAQSLEVPPKVINDALKRADWDGNGKTEDYQRCCELIMDMPGLDVNVRDVSNGNYPLHYAVKYAGKKNVSKLLQKKASLANRDNLNLLTMAEIDHDTLQKHFDSCLEAHPGDPKDQSREGMYLTFDYTTLFPTPASKNAHVQDCESQILQEKNSACAPVKESDVVLHLTRDKELKPLLQHPLIVSFLYVKWHRVRFLFIANLMAYLLFCASLLWFILSNYDEPDNVPMDVPYVLLFVTTFVISVREAFQVLLMTKKYVKNTENYVEVGLLVDVYFMLFYSSTAEQRRPMFAFAILLAALELLFLLGSIPGMSTYIVMLRTVSFNFLKFLLFNAILILAFAFSFYTLFRKSPTDDATATTTKALVAQDEAEEEKKPEFFANIYLAVFKTLVMITGEFEAGDLDFEQYPVASHLIFIMFVLLIAIILLNLLNGLAVSDTQEIKSEAKLVALTARAQYVSYVESMVFDNVLPAICLSRRCACAWGTKTTWSKWMLSRICIKQHLTDDCLKVYPNQEGRIAWRNTVGTQDTCAPCCGGNKIDEGTIKLTKAIITRDEGGECGNCQQMYAMVQELLRLQRLKE